MCTAALWKLLKAVRSVAGQKKGIIFVICGIANKNIHNVEYISLNLLGQKVHLMAHRKTGGFPHGQKVGFLLLTCAEKGRDVLTHNGRRKWKHQGKNLVMRGSARASRT